MMDTNNLSDSYPVIETIKNALAEEVWPQVFPAIEHNPVVWRSLKNANFRREVTSLAGNHPERWSPAEMSLIALGNLMDSDEFHNRPDAKLPSHVSALTGSILAAFERGELHLSEDDLTPAEFGPEVQPLAEAGLLAMAIRDRFLASRDWETVPILRSGDSSAILNTAYACLLGYIREPFQLLGKFFASNRKPVDRELAIHAILSNPFPVNDMTNLLYSLIGRLNPSEQVSTLQFLRPYRPQIAQILARRFLEIWPEENGKPEDGLIKRLNILDLKTSLYLIANQPDRVTTYLEKSWSSTRGLEEKLATQLMDLAVTDREQMAPLLEILNSWDIDPSGDNFSPVLPARLSVALSSSGYLNEAENYLDPESSHPEMKYAHLFWKIKNHGPESAADDPLGIEVLERVMEYEKEKPDYHFPYYESMGDIFLNAGLPLEANLAFSRALDRMPGDPDLLAKLGRLNETANHLETSRSLIQAAVVLAPERVDLRYQLAEASEHAGDWESALQERITLLERVEQPDIEDLRALANCAIHNGEYELAIEVCNQGMQIDPNDGVVYALLGEALYHEGRAELAVENLLKATQLSPHLPTPWLSLYWVYEQIGDAARAKEILQTAALAAPDSPGIHLALGKVYFEDNALTKAVTCLQTAANLAPENPEIAYHFGQTLQHLGRFEKAHQAMTAAHIAAPYDLRLAYAYGQVLIKLNQPRQAINALVPVIQAQPDSPAPYLDYAEAILEIGEGTEEAVTALRKCLTLEPGNLLAQALLAEGLLKTGKLDEALESYRRVLDSPLADDRVWQPRLCLGLGQVSLQMGETEAALAAFKEALAYNPEDPAIFRHLAEAYHLAGLDDDALRSARDALSLGANSIDILGWFAEMAARLDAQVEAIQALDRAIELDPQRADLQLLLAKTRNQTGDSEGAREAYDNVIGSGQVTKTQLEETAEGLIALGDPTAAVACYELANSRLAGPDPELLIHLSEAHILAGNPQAALIPLDQAIGFLPENPVLQMKKANLLLRLDRKQAAMACMEQAISLGHDSPEIPFEAVQILRRLGDLDTGLRHAERLVKNQPENLSGRTLAAELARAMLQIDYALRILRDGWPTGVEPQDNVLGGPDLEEKLAFFCLFAELCLEEEDEIAAAEAFMEAIQLNPGHPRVQALQIRFNHRKGDADLASEELDLEIGRLWAGGNASGSSEEKDPAISLGLADAALELGEWSIAQRLYEDFLDQFPGEPYLNLRLARLHTLRAEDQRLCIETQVRRHAPGDSALSEDARRAFEEALAVASQGYSEENLADAIRRWRARGKTVFDADKNSIYYLAGLKTSTDVAARIAGLRQVGERKAAIKAARKYPYDTLVQSQLALTLLDGTPGEALKAAQTARDHQPESPILQALVAMTAIESGDKSTALDSIQKALALWPDEARWHTFAARLLLEKGSSEGGENITTAIFHLEKAAELEPGEVQNYLSLGQACLWQGDYPSAISALESATQIDPNQPSGWLLLARAYFAAGELQNAKNATGKALALNDQELDAYLINARIALIENDPGESLNQTRAALKIQKDHPEALFMLALAMETLNKPEEALGVLEKALPEAPEPLPLLIKRVELLKKTAGQEVALAALNELNEGYPEEPHVQSLMAKTLLGMNRSEEALAAARRALRSGEEVLPGPQLAQIHHIIGTLLRRDGQLDQAVHHLSEAVQHNPGDVESLLELGRTQLDRRQLHQALDVFDQAIQIAREDPRPYYQAGLALKENKDYGKAEVMLRRAAEISPNDVSIHRQLGAVVALNIVHNNREASLRE